MLGEDYDAQKEIAGWDEPGLDVTNWVAVDRAHGSGAPARWPGRPAGAANRRAQPQSMKELKPGHWIFDLGQNMVGFVRLKVSEPAGTRS